VKVILGPVPCHFCRQLVILRADHWCRPKDCWAWYWSNWHPDLPPSGSVHRCPPAASAGWRTE